MQIEDDNEECVPKKTEIKVFTWSPDSAIAPPPPSYFLLNKGRCLKMPINSEWQSWMDQQKNIGGSSLCVHVTKIIV